MLSFEILWLTFLKVNCDFLVPTECASTDLLFHGRDLVLPGNLAPQVCKVTCPKSKIPLGKKACASVLVHLDLGC